MNPTNRFYGVAVPPEVLAAIDEDLTDPGDEDLVRAHLKNNYAYFGGIDKTLAGFVVLDSEGDNYYLWDAREPGQVWWQDHETRDISLRFDGVAEYRSFQRERGEADEDELFKRYGASSRRTGPAPSTPELADRYQWLVWLLAQPLKKKGIPVQGAQELTRSAAGHFFHFWPDDAAVEKAFAVESPRLSSDPHLALYWLLHATMRAEDERRDRVLERMGRDIPLLDHFRGHFGTIGLSDDMTAVPNFRERRSLFSVFFLERCGAPGSDLGWLRALEMDPVNGSLRKSLPVARSLKEGKASAEMVHAALDRCGRESPGTLLLAALLDKMDGRTGSLYADRLAGSLKTAPDPILEIAETVSCVRDMIIEKGTLAGVVQRLLKKDAHHPGFLKMALQCDLARGTREFGLPEDLEREIARGEKTEKALEIFFADSDRWREAADSLDPSAARILARRLLFWAEEVQLKPDVAAWAVETVAEGPETDRLAVVGRGLKSLRPPDAAELLEIVRGRISGAGSLGIQILLALFREIPEPPENDFSDLMTVQDLKREAADALFPYAHIPAVFDSALRALVPQPRRTTVDALVGRWFYPLEANRNVLPRLSDKQAERAARVLVLLNTRYADPHVHSDSGHQLYRFNHVGAQDFLIRSLHRMGDWYAREKNPARAKRLEAVVANLYAAVRGLNTPESREAMSERVFRERRSYWRLGSAVGDVWSPAFHAGVMQKMDQRRSLEGASAYAYAIGKFLAEGTLRGSAHPMGRHRGPALIEMAEKISGWTPRDDLERGMAAFVLTEGVRAALEARRGDLACRLHGVLAALNAPPVNPERAAEGKPTPDPFADEAVQKALTAALSGEMDMARERLLVRLREARNRSSPARDVTNDDLSLLARVFVRERVLDDPESGEVWFSDPYDALHRFDGYGLSDERFPVDPFGFGPMRDFFEGVEEVSDRQLVWSGDLSNFREATRYGDRILLGWGINNGRLRRWGIIFLSAEAATRAFERLRANPPWPGSQGNPWYIDGVGAVQRTYYLPPEPGKNSPATRMDSLLEEDPAAVAAYNRKELELLREKGGWLGVVEWNNRLRRDHDLTLREWLKRRERNDKLDPRWHLKAIMEYREALERHGLAAEDVRMSLSPGMTAREEAAFLAKVGGPVPETLLELWRVAGGARWSVDKTEMRFLSPTQMLESRAKAAQVVESYAAQVPELERNKARAGFRNLFVLIDVAGVPVSFFLAGERPESRVFCHAKERPGDLWWEKSLGWILSTGFVQPLEEALAARFPMMEELWYGQVFNSKALRRRFQGSEDGVEKFVELVLDESNFNMVCRQGIPGSPGSVKSRRFSDAPSARRAFEEELRKIPDGFEELK